MCSSDNKHKCSCTNKCDKTGLPESEVLRLIQELKDYTRESRTILGFDERTPEEFLEIFLNKDKLDDH